MEIQFCKDGNTLQALRLLMLDGADGQDQLQTFYCPFQAIATVVEEGGKEGRGWGGFSFLSFQL